MLASCSTPGSDPHILFNRPPAYPLSLGVLFPAWFFFSNQSHLLVSINALDKLFIWDWTGWPCCWIVAHDEQGMVALELGLLKNIPAQRES